MLTNLKNTPNFSFLLDGASFDFDEEKIANGKLSPVFFGSALNNFGIEPFLEHFLEMTTSPLPRVARGIYRVATRLF